MTAKAVTIAFVMDAVKIEVAAVDGAAVETAILWLKEDATVAAFKSVALDVRIAARIVTGAAMPLRADRAP